MKKAIAVFLAVMICICALSGCGEKTPDVADEKTEISAAAQPETVEEEKDEPDTEEEAAEPSDEESGGNAEDAEEAKMPGNLDDLADKVFVWDEASFAFTELTTDLGNWGSQLNAPDGKWVMALFQITDGKIECGRLKELIMEQENIRLDELLPKTVVEQGDAIEDNAAYAVGLISVFFDVDENYDLENAALYVTEQIEAAEETVEGEVEATTGPVQVTAPSGAELTLTPIEGDAFAGQDDDTSVYTRVGTTVHNGGSQFWPGSCLRLSSMRDTRQYTMPKAVFTYESSLDTDAVADAIGEIGEAAVLSLNGTEYPVQVAWITENMACFFFDCEDPISDVPAFGVRDGNLYIVG